MNVIRPTSTSCTVTEESRGHRVTLDLQYQDGHLLLSLHAGLTHSRPLLEMKRHVLQQALQRIQSSIDMLDRSAPPAPTQPV